MKTKTYVEIIMASCFALAVAHAEPSGPGKKAAAKPLPTPESEFKRLDANSDGKLSVTELSADRKPENARKLLAKDDTNEDGFLQLKECRTAMVWRYPQSLFNEYDRDKDGKINLEEFTAQVKKKDKARSWFNSLDWDSNQKLSFPEFKKIRK